jgi:hypothetical protein
MHANLMTAMLAWMHDMYQGFMQRMRRPQVLCKRVNTCLTSRDASLCLCTDAGSCFWEPRASARWYGGMLPSRRHRPVRLGTLINALSFSARGFGRPRQSSGRRGAPMSSALPAAVSLWRAGRDAKVVVILCPMKKATEEWTEETGLSVMPIHGFFCVGSRALTANEKVLQPTGSTRGDVAATKAYFPGVQNGSLPAFVCSSGLSGDGLLTLRAKRIDRACSDLALAVVVEFEPALFSRSRGRNIVASLRQLPFGLAFAATFASTLGRTITRPVFPDFTKSSEAWGDPE